ncbi:MAG TPA: response regulator [Dongiaceae bacterium]|nr:response regulator [Dongiaceae bacterium]
MIKEQVILLVEDNADDEELTKLAFSMSNIANRLVVVRDGVEALDYLYSTGSWAGRPLEDDPCIVLLDLKLPRIGGLEVLKRLRENPLTRLLPVVIMTSSVEEQDLIRGYDLGANSYIRKPVDFEQFTEAVKILGLYWLVLNQPPLSTRPGGEDK